jgi:hypothetical protein
MTKFKLSGAKIRTGAKIRERLSGRLMLGLGLSAAVLLLNAANVSAGVKSSFTDPATSVQVASLESQKQVVGSEELSNERAKGYTPGMLSTPEDASKVAVILWDDAWSELQRRARSASAAAGSNAGTNIAGSSGGRSN